MNKEIKENKKTLAVSQILLLLLGIISFAFILGSEVKTVSASDPSTDLRGDAFCEFIGSGVEFFVGGQACDDNKVCDYNKKCVEKSGIQITETLEETKIESSSSSNTPTISDLISAAVLWENFQKIIKNSKTVTGTSGVVETGAAEVAAGTQSTTATGAAAKTGFFTFKWLKQGAITSNLGYIAATVGVAAASAAIVWGVFKIAGAGERNMKEITGAAITSASTAIVVASALKLLGGSSVVPGLGLIGAAVGIATLLWAAMTYQLFSQEVIIYQSSLWQPATGGERCEDCNMLSHGCSEYQCKAYGAGCVLMNKGTELESCAWNNSRDFNPPKISLLRDYLDTNFEYEETSPNSAKLIYTGKDASENNCIPAFTAIKFGVKTDEIAQCKISLTDESNYQNMTSYLIEGSAYTYNHTLQIPNSAFPSNYSLSESGFLLENGRTQNFYIKCQDPNGNTNIANYLINFCIDEGPDTTAPEISTNVPQTYYVKYGTKYDDKVQVYTNEPAECRWDTKDVAYESMLNNMTDCSTKIGDYLVENSYLYGCNANLTGIRDGQKNMYYIRCLDKPLLTETSKEKRIANKQSYTLTIIGTKQLVIDTIYGNKLALYKDNKTQSQMIVDSTIPLKLSLEVKTLIGAQDGKSICYYRDIKSSYRYQFENEGSYDFVNPNKQDLLFSNSGIYDYEITCCDIANNCDSENIKFTIYLDLLAPEVSRVYYDAGKLNIITNEAAECVYSTNTCTYAFEDGLSLGSSEDIYHSVNWNTDIDLHIKCKDKFGNLPDTDVCQIVARASNYF